MCQVQQLFYVCMVVFFSKPERFETGVKSTGSVDVTLEAA